MKMSRKLFSLFLPLLIFVFFILPVLQIINLYIHKQTVKQNIKKIELNHAEILYIPKYSGEKEIYFNGNKYDVIKTVKVNSGFQLWAINDIVEKQIERKLSNEVQHYWFKIMKNWNCYDCFLQHKVFSVNYTFVIINNSALSVGFVEIPFLPPDIA